MIAPGKGNTMDYTHQKRIAEELGLKEAIGGLMRTMGNAHSIRVTTEIPELKGVFPEGQEIHCFRILETLLNGILQTTGASELSLAVTLDPSRGLRMELSHDGPTLTAAESGEAKATIASTKHRLRFLNGRMEKQRRAGKETMVLYFPPTPPSKSWKTA